MTVGTDFTTVRELLARHGTATGFAARDAVTYPLAGTTGASAEPAALG